MYIVFFMTGVVTRSCKYTYVINTENDTLSLDLR